MYCTLNDIKSLLPEGKLIQLVDDELLKPAALDDDNPQHSGMFARIDAAIQSACAEVDGYLSSRYTVPLNAVTDVVNGLAVEISIYNLYRRRTVTDDIQKRYDRAAARLKDIAKGLMGIGIAQSAQTQTEPTAGGGVCTPNNRIFTNGSMRDF